ncbi:MAG: cell division protein PerM [Jiangellaceae bacterium]
MTDLLARPLLRRDEPAWGSRVPWLAGVLAAAWALVAGLALAALPGVLVWIDDGADAPAGDPLRAGAHLWLLAHRTGLDVGGAEIRLAPWGLSMLFVLLLYRAGRWAAHGAGVSTLRSAMSVALPAVAAYAVGAGVVAAVSSIGEVRAEPGDAALWAALVAVGAVSAGVVHDAGLAPSLLDRLPSWSRPAVFGGAVVVAGLCAVGAVLVAVSAVAHSEQISELAEAFDAGSLGTVLLALAGAAFALNAVLWGAAFALGPGFAVGAGTAVGPGGVELGMVPALPALGALPAGLPGPEAWLVLAGPVAVGVLTGVVVHRRSAGPLAIALAQTVLAVAGAAVVMSVLALLSGGSAGAVRLAVVGPEPWQVALATLLVIGLPAAATVALVRRRSAGVSSPAAPGGDAPTHR